MIYHCLSNLLNHVVLTLQHAKMYLDFTVVTLSFWFLTISGVGVEVLNAESSKRLKENQSPWNHENKILFVSSVKLSIVCRKEITRPLSRI
jgi:hypothetical protein